MKKIFSLFAAMIAAMTLSAQTPIVKSCAEAAAIALALTENNAPTEEVYSITGYVTNVVSAVSKGQQTFWMDDEKGDKKTFESYYCNLPKDDQNTLNVGDKVKIVGKIMKYNTTPEMKNGDITILNRVVVLRDTFTVTTCEAYDKCSSLSDGDASIDYFIVRDKVMSVDDTNENYGWQNITFQCEEGKLLVGYHINFGGKDNFCAVGDSVEIIGTLKNYGGKMEIEGKGVVFAKGQVVIDNLNNIITYTATSKLTETTDTYSAGLHTNAFNTAISSHTFSNGTGTITFSGELTTIGNYAFHGCSGLTSVTIPNSVTTIGEGAFYECSGLASPVYNNTIFAFMPTSYTGAYTIPNGITQIAGGAFAYCGGLTSVTIPNSVTTIGNYAFRGCSGLTSVTIPSSVTTIGEGAFYECSGLTSVTIPSSVTTIGEGAFYECSGLTSITIPNSVTTIGNYAFAYCTSLTSVTIPNSVTTIGDYAFAYCSGLTSVTIPNSVTTIGNYAFYYCSGLSDIYSYATIPPTCENEDVFDGVNQHCYIHVPAGTVRAYELAVGWSHFLHFFEISEVPSGSTDQVSVEVTNNTAVFSWPVNPTASSYTLVIKKNDEVFCTLTFNSLGQLVGMAFAPARGANNNSSAQSTAYGYSFMVSNLDASSTYDYLFTAKDINNQVLSTTTGQFKTEGTATDLPSLSHEGKDGIGAVKMIMNGQLYILRDNKLYNAAGVEVK